MKNKISVVMPVYNAGRFLREAIESVLGQTHENFELVIVDDCSSDNSVQIVKSFDDERIILIENKQNTGNYPCRNRGIKQATGEFIAVMDADDIMVPERMDTQLLFLLNNEQYMAVGSDVFVVDENSKEKGIWSKHSNNFEEIKVRLLKDNVCTHPTLMLRSEVFKKHGIYYNEKYLYSADYELLYQISKIGKITNIKIPLLKYRVHSGQITAKKKNEQDLYKHQIQLKQLERFGISAPDFEQIENHLNLVNLDKGQEWLNYLIEHTDFYDKNILLNEFCTSALLYC
ncbi:glycosyltransferase [Paludibacter sp. 221]|uniref:glycosyltransferase family 2 protein n=1 Tax=Paludibacter sp. 221 TaxID=2302939 RepID=UPI0013D22B31|nr:glycosyltransferase [Paludibacter sp. 221]NDV46180.1 glycosyltransferase [Paludibacter sp. 221]